MRNNMTGITLLAVAAALACGGSSTTGGGTCTITTSGGQTGTWDCGVFAAAWSSSSNQGAFSAGATDAAHDLVSVAMGISGQPHAGTFKFSDAGAVGGISVTANGNSSSWFAGHNSSTDSQGDYTLTITSLSETVSNSGGKAYRVGGTLDATLPALSGSSATGTVTLHATF